MFHNKDSSLALNWCDVRNNLPLFKERSPTWNEPGVSREP